MTPSTTTIRIQTKMSPPYPSMDELPVPVMVDILSRLPVKTIVQCKCVCKTWLNIILDPYFADLQLSRSPVGFMVHHDSLSDKKRTKYFKPGVWKWVEVKDELDHHHLHHDPVMCLDLNFAAPLQDCGVYSVGSVNGFICLRQNGYKSKNTYIGNPITREYIILKITRIHPWMKEYNGKDRQYTNYSFGVGSVTKEYKVIRIFKGDLPSTSISASRPNLLEAEVYTLGTGQWRSLGHVPYLINGFIGLFLNGRAHWVIRDENSSGRIGVFDFDKETFELIPSPPFETMEYGLSWLRILNGCLSQYYTYDSKLTVWVMKEYGIIKSWHKELVMERRNDMSDLEPARIVHGFKDGTLLMTINNNDVIVYCPRRKTIIDTEVFDGSFNGFAYRPSFYRLLNFQNERVHVF